MACLVGGLLARLLEILVNYHWVLKPVILGALGLDTNVLLVVTSYSRVVHATSGTINDAWLGNPTVAPKELLLVPNGVLRRNGLNI